MGRLNDDKLQAKIMMITNFGIEEACYEGPVDTHLQAVSVTPLKVVTAEVKIANDVFVSIIYRTLPFQPPNILVSLKQVTLYDSKIHFV